MKTYNLFPNYTPDILYYLDANVGDEAMKELSDKNLLVAYREAKYFRLKADFIRQIENEMKLRNIDIGIVGMKEMTLDMNC